MDKNTKLKKYSFLCGATLAITLGASQVATAACMPHKSPTKPLIEQASVPTLGGQVALRSMMVGCTNDCW